MNETKRAWQDVATILQEAGWPAPGSDEQGSPLMLPPPRRQSSLYRLLPVGAILAIVAGLIAFTFVSGSIGRQPNASELAELSRQFGELKSQVDALQDAQDRDASAIRKAERSVNGAMAKVETASATVTKMRRAVDDLEATQDRVKADLEAASKALHGLKDDLRKEVSTLNNEVKKEREQRLSAFQQLKKLIDAKTGKREADASAEEKKAIEGLWRVASTDAEQRILGLPKELFFEFKEGTVTAKTSKKPEGKTHLRGQYELGHSEELKSIKIKWEKGEDEKDLFSSRLRDLPDGLYELNGQQLKLLLAPPGQRPNTLAIHGRIRAVLITLHRDKR